MAIADSVYAVQEVGGVATDTRSTPSVDHRGRTHCLRGGCASPGFGGAPVEITGMRAVALPLLAQALAVAIQLYAFFGEIARGERLVTVVVLVA